MKINDINRAGAVNPYRKHLNTGQANQVDKKGKATDGVQFSEEAMKLLESHSTATTDPARAVKLEELKQAVSTGTYHVDARDIAEKLLPYLRENN